MTDPADTRAAGLAVPVDSLASYNEAADEARARSRFGRTADDGDPDVGWTVLQSSPRADEHPGGGDGYVSPLNELPGQVYLPSQLPDPTVAADAGFTPQPIPAHLVTDDPTHLQGPELLEALALEHREALRSAVAEQVTGSPRATADAPADESVSDESVSPRRRRAVPDPAAE